MNSPIIINGVQPQQRVPRPLFIFDLDGTISLSQHRAHFIEKTDDPDRWQKWNEACDQDPPNWPVISVMTALLMLRADVRIWTGRCESVRKKTVAWLQEHAIPEALAPTRKLHWMLTMRPVGDHTEDTELKRQWLQALPPEDLGRVMCVFEDRTRMVDMWRAEGLACFQVAPGKF